MTKTYTIKNLTCANCAAKYEKKLNESGVLSDVSVNILTNKIKANQKDDVCKREYLQSEINKIEDGVTICCTDDCKYCHVESREVDEKRGLVFKIVMYSIAALLILFAVFFEHNVINIEFPLHIVLYSLGYLLVAYDIILNMFRAFRERSFFDENTLMVVASIGALVIASYVEAIAVMVFYKVGEYFQERAVEKSKKNIKGILDLRPDTANLVRDNEVKVVNPSELSINDIILVKAGEKVPVDGIIIKGKSSIDARALSGESLPVDKKEDDLVYSGSINLNNPIEVKVLKLFKDSTASKIIEFVENNSAKKAKTEKFITKFAKVYTPVVVILALVFAFIVPMFTSLINHSSYISELLIYGERAIVFLVISCPCALVLSVPLTFFSGIGAASKMGVLFKSSSDLETIRKTNTFIFDKTGTLTKGVFEVVSIETVNGIDATKLIEYAAAAENNSNHPIAKSISNHYGKTIDIKYVENIEDVFGKGISVSYKGDLVVIGNDKYFSDKGIDIRMCNEVGTIVYVAINNGYAGHIVIADTIKETSRETIDYLLENKKNVYMLTGDNELSAADVASRLGITDYYYGKLPIEKSEIINELKEKNESVTFIGDGINDAPVLTTATIGISMGGIGSDVAIEASDIVLMHDEPRSIVNAIEISKKTNVIAKENIVFSLIIKIATMILGAFGLPCMLWIAVFADVGVALIAVLNAIRILYSKKLKRA